MDIRFANRLRHDDGSEYKEGIMMEPKRNDVSGLSPIPVSSVHSEEGRLSPHRTPLRLTISVEKIDRVLADIQKQVEDLQREMTNLRLVRNQLAAVSKKIGEMKETHRTSIPPSWACRNGAKQPGIGLRGRI